MAQSDIKQVLCIKWGDRYGAEYVNRIYAMVERNITPPFRVICFTEDNTGIREEVICHDLPELGCERPTNAPGKWPKTTISRQIENFLKTASPNKAVWKPVK